MSVSIASAEAIIDKDMSLNATHTLCISVLPYRNHLSPERHVMPDKEKYLDAARKAPSDRNNAERALVEDGIRRGMQSVKNEAQATETRLRQYGR